MGSAGVCEKDGGFQVLLRIAGIAVGVRGILGVLGMRNWVALCACVVVVCPSESRIPPSV